MRRNLAGCFGALMVVNAQTAACQATAEGVVVIGRVSNEAGSPVASASLELADRRGRRIGSTGSRDDGRFTIASSGGREFVLHVRRLGYAADSAPVHSSGPADTVVVDFVLRFTAHALGAVETRAERPRSTHQAGSYRRPPGGRQSSVEAASGLYGSLNGDLQAALLAVPGVVAAGPGGMSAFGLPGESNGASLNGIESWASRLPRDGVRRTIRLSTYDPRVGRFSGFHVNTEIPSGTTIQRAAVRASIDDISSVADAERILSGTQAGPLGSATRFYNLSYQVMDRSAGIATIADAESDVLADLGLTKATVDSLAAAAAHAGLPVEAFRGPRDDRREVSGALRIDLTPNDGPMVNTSGSVLYALLTGSAISRRSPALAFPGLPLGDRRASQSEAQAMVHYAPYIGGALTQFRVARGIMRGEERATGPGLSAVVLMRDPEPVDGPLTAVSIGAPPQPTGRIRRDFWFGSVESEWPTWNGAHRLTVHANAGWEGIRTDHRAGSGGTYLFAGREEFSSGIASEFRRWVGAREGAGTMRRATLALSDVYVHDPRSRLAVAAQDVDGLVVQAGMRVDVEVPRFPASRDSLVESAFGLRTDVVPHVMAFQPMLGFTWREGLTRVFNGPAVITEARNTVSGGVRLYQSSLSTAGMERVLRSGALFETRCVGDAVPSPPWDPLTGADEGATTCQTGTGSPGPRSGQVIFADGFRPPSSLRAEISWRRAISRQLAGSFNYTWAANSALPDRADVNFTGNARASLGLEDGRPLYVDPGLIDAATGSVLPSGSRRLPDLGQVTTLRSDARTRAREVTVGLEWRFGAPRVLRESETSPTRTALLRLAYSRARQRVSASGFASTTAGDPRATEWFDAGSPEHVLRAWYTLYWDRVAAMSVFGVIASGARYSPLVGGDINGDGLVNDRAFIFDDSRSGATLPNGWDEMMASVDASARRCLRRQRGSIAGPNSCTAPVSVSIPAIAIALDPRMLKMRQGSTVNVYVYDPLRLVSAAAGHPHWARAWERSQPNPVLLYPTGFDPDAGRFTYGANRSFGVTRRAAGLRGGRIAIDVRLEVGTHPETHIVRRIVREARGGPLPLQAELREQVRAAATMMGEGDLPTVLALADSLQLTPRQRELVDSLHRGYLERRDSMYAALVPQIAEAGADLTSRRIRRTWHATVSEVVRARYHTAWAARDLLTPAQREWLRQRGLAASFDATAASVQRILDGPLPPW